MNSVEESASGREIPVVTTGIEARRLLQGSAMHHHVMNTRKAVRGAKILEIGYAVNKEYGEATPVLLLDNGNTIHVQCDDEGNGPGVLMVSNENGEDVAVLCQCFPK